MHTAQKEHNKYLLRKKLVNICLKVFLIILVLSISVWIGITLFSSKGRVLFFNLIASNLLNLEVKPAIISGITEKGLRYNITSETIENYISNFFYKNNINFSNPIIKLELDNGNTVDISSRRGQLNERENLFYLKDKVEILSRDGTSLESSLITLDINKSEISTHQKTVAIDNGNYLYSKGFILSNSFNNLTIYGPIVISDTNIVEDNLYTYNIFNKIYLETTKDIFIDNKAKTIITKSPFFGFKEYIKYSADSFNINYLNLERFKNSKNTISNFSRIEMNSNVVIRNNKNDGVLRGDKYIYNILKNTMILTSNNKPTTYEDNKYFVSVTDRFEFNTLKNTVVARGNPHFISKNNDEKNYDITAKLAYAKLTSKNNEIEYAEIFDNIVIKSQEGSTIYADYGYLDYVQNILYLKDNVKVIDNQNDIIESCELILDIQSGNTKLVKCSDQDNIKSTINKTKIEKRKSNE